MRARSPQFYVYLFALQFNRFALIKLKRSSSEQTASVLRDEDPIVGPAGGGLDSCRGVDPELDGILHARPGVGAGRSP